MPKESKLPAYFVDSKFIVTGANSFVGNHLCTAMHKFGLKPVQFVRTTFSNLQNEGSWVELDLTNRNMVNEIISTLKPDYVVHLAGSKNRNDASIGFRSTFDRNMSISSNVIESCMAVPGFKKLIFLGSCDEYGLSQSPFNESHQESPTNSYGLSKLAITKLLSTLYYSHQFPSLVLRPSVIFGPNQGDEMFLPALIQSLLAGKEYPMTYGDQIRDFIYIDDVVDGIFKALLFPNTSDKLVVNIGAGVSLGIKYIAHLTARLIHPSKINLLKIGAVPYRRNEVMNYCVNIDRARNLLGWQPTTKLEQGLHQTINYYKSRLDLSN
jgi:nucleoside-diphosphate-sugar epimerase